MKLHWISYLPCLLTLLTGSNCKRVERSCGGSGNASGTLCYSCVFQLHSATGRNEQNCVTSPWALEGRKTATCAHGCVLSRSEHPVAGVLSFTRGCSPSGAEAKDLNCTTSPFDVEICEAFCNGDLCNYESGPGNIPRIISVPLGISSTAPVPLIPPTPATITPVVFPSCPSEEIPRNCLDVLQTDQSARTGRYYVYPSGVRVSVWCDMDTAGGGWTVILRRFNGSLDFYRDWDDFKHGFGFLNGGEFWVGNDNIHLLTYQGDNEFRIDMVDVNGPTFAEWEHFAVADEANKYKLSVRGFKPSARIGDSLAYHNNMPFSTRDRNYDPYSGNCAESYKAGGWWFNKCYYAYLTGRYQYSDATKGAHINGAMCFLYKVGVHASALPLQSASMKLRPSYRPKDCWDILEKFPRATSGVYTVYLGAASTYTGTPVYCDMTTDGGGWTMLLRRLNGSVDFYKKYAEYEKPIGSAYGEHWLGLLTIHLISSQRKYELRVDVESNSEKRFSQYSRFVVGNSADQYRLHVSGYYTTSTAGDSLLSHDQQTFSAKDKKTNNQCSGNCAISSTGGWWYDCCHTSNLLGTYDYTARNQGHVKSYAKSVIWSSFKGLDYSLKTAEMKLRPQLPCKMRGGLTCSGNGHCFNDLTRGQAACHCKAGFSGDKCQLRNS